MAGPATQSWISAKDASALWNFLPENFAAAIRILLSNGKPAPVILQLIRKWKYRPGRRSILLRPPRETIKRSKITSLVCESSLRAYWVRGVCSHHFNLYEFRLKPSGTCPFQDLWGCPRAWRIEPAPATVLSPGPCARRTAPLTPTRG